MFFSEPDPVRSPEGISVKRALLGPLRFERIRTYDEILTAFRDAYKGQPESVMRDCVATHLVRGFQYDCEHRIVFVQLANEGHSKGRYRVSLEKWEDSLGFND